MRTLISALAALTLSTVGGCKESADDENAVPSAQKQVEQAQEESADAYERAKQAQETAAEEAREAARAQDNVNEKRQELSEAESKAAVSQHEAQEAQERARAEGEAAHAEAQQAQARASEIQTRAQQETRTRSIPTPTSEHVVSPNAETHVETRNTGNIDTNVDTWNVDTVETRDVDADFDVGTNIDARSEIDRLQAKINAAVERVKYGASVAGDRIENAGERLENKLDRYRD